MLNREGQEEGDKKAEGKESKEVKRRLIGHNAVQIRHFDIVAVLSLPPQS